MNLKRINIEYEILLFLLNQESHGREISKNLKFPLTNVQRTLLNLLKKNILDYRISGKNKLYFIKRNILAKNYIYNSENYKLIKLIQEYPFFEPLIEQILKKCNSCIIILFGSYSRFSPKKNSDIDLYIETKNRKLKKEIELINSKINVKIGFFDKDSLLIKEIIKNHIIIQGMEAYYGKIKFFE